ncbi:phytanoyl-CoA dioxygenase family protein [Sphingobium phenoxybenzoativorans]|jgi:ectoine hydroxylase-related dioxygenase (phytanoyl-CoA dioxygenase family)|uniref:Phytanoyl-CoA dioxygenase family protein n=1 Tax=Sphingobium phenoxybenzoativorans TaxID=1592790 RepID=A0A975K6D5_9SPHN|nr:MULTISPECIES: phytanoyl-CoA dioxygenase family protein [Sphingobium]QUT05633.1 phytanoyl-CoA dioxygenase family protein [Sphingobium phenoxybenzoativorans]WDA39261.1 phytanoyl-CoA dioxygenase family protein [Sphingobium sp. YC-XJ3]
MAQDAALLTARLFADGYCIVPIAVTQEAIAALDRDVSSRFAATPFCEGDFYGARTKRFGALLRRSSHVAALVRHRLILDIVEAALSPYCQRVALNLTQAVELHPGALAQIPHRDEDLYGGPKGEIEYQVNVLWPLTPFTAANGATRVWPGSHRIGAPADPGGDPGIAVIMPPGSALVWLGSTLHGGGANLTDTVRRAVIVGYTLGWLRSFENQYLVYPPDIARTFDPDLAALVGYAQHLPNLGNVEGQCPSILLRDPSLDNLAAIDALRPDQAAALRDYVATQEAARAGLIGG